MMPRSPGSGRTRWIGVVAVLVLAIGVDVGVRQSRRPPDPAPIPAPPPMPAGLPDTMPGGDVVDQALQNAGLDSAVIKSRWIEDVHGVDLAGLPPARREIFLRYANAERCTCGCGYTLAGCRSTDMSCEVSGPHLMALLDSVKTGRITSTRGIRARPAG